MPDVQRLKEDEIKAQMGLVDGEDRDLLTEEEQSSRHNISHNSDNGYLYQDADFLCGAIIKERKALAEERERSEVCRALLEEYQWVYYPFPLSGEQHCIKCGARKSDGCAPDCAIAAQLAGTKGGK